VTQSNRQWRVLRTPVGDVTPDVFGLSTEDVVAPEDGEVLVKVGCISMEPAYRLYMDPTDHGYLPYAAPGEVMFGYAIGEVVESRAPNLRPGDVVEGLFGWQEHATVSADKVVRRTLDRPLPELLGALGITGMTAYEGVIATGRVAAGETVLISSAAGAVGSIAGQLAKHRGCRVVGIAGGPAKVRWLHDELGFDDAIDYKAGDLASQLDAVCPEGVDLYFDNVGGQTLAAVIPRMKRYGRVILCGFLSTYASRELDFDYTEFIVGVITTQLQLSGIHAPTFIETPQGRIAERELAAWLDDGSLTAPTDLRQGIEVMPEALCALFRGEKLGKMMVEL
jgi:NADPH-dependent curcumin reductase CurA